MHVNYYPNKRNVHERLSTSSCLRVALQVLFKDVRHRPASKQPSPVMVHVNYHPDKHSRMIAIFKFYGGDRDALRSFPGGSEPGS